MSHLELTILGPPQVKLDGHLVTGFEADKVRALLIYLAVESGHPHRREQLATLFWPGWPDASARTSLRNALSNLRSAIGDAAADPPFLLITRETLQFNPDSSYTLDTLELEQSANNPNPSIDQLQTALNRYRGNFLEGFTLKDCPKFDDWSQIEREQMQVTASSAFSRLAENYEKEKNFEKAVGCVRKRLSLEPWQEDAHRQLMRLLTASGQRPAALAQFEACKRALKDELEVEPSAETVKLYESIRDSQPAESFPVKVPHHNLPAPLTSFIGRQKEITRVKSLLSAYRLVTLTGSGGTGKTRLALKVAESVLESFPDGAWLVELAPLTDPEMVALSVAYELGMRDTSGQNTHEILANYLRDKSLLLILDNCEHLIEACAWLADRLLQACPRLVILTTSREALGIGGETAFRLPSLAFPDAQQTLSLDILAQLESVQLFVERASTVQPNFALTSANAADVAQICRRLDGIPLTIELAAARVRMMTAGQINDRLDDAFRLLTGGSRTALPRHQTLEAAIGWSYDLLAKVEKILLDRLSVFTGGWTLEAAEQVCSDAEIEGKRTESTSLAQGDILDLLGRLVDKSLITLEISATGTGRYHILETVRQYAHNRLAEGGEQQGGDSQILQDRHFEYFLQLALKAEPHLRGFGGPEWLDRLEEELDNLRLAVHLGMTGRVLDDLRLVNGLFYFFHIHGHSTEGIEWYKKLLSAETMLPALADPAEQGSRRLRRARGLLRVANLANMHSSLYTIEQDRKELEESVAILRELGPEVSHDLAMALIYLSATLSDPAQAAASFREGMGLAQKIGDKFLIAECIWWSSNPRYEQGEVEQVKAMVEERLALLRAISDQDGIGSSLYFLALYAVFEGEYGRAAALFDESLVNVHSVRNQWSLGTLFQYRTLLARAQGDYPQAIHWAEEGLAIFRVLDEKHHILVFLYELGMAAWAAGDFQLAARQGNEVLALAKEIGIGASTFLAHHLLGRIALSQGDLALAQQHLQRMITERASAKVSIFIPPASNGAHPIDTAYLLETLAVLASALGAVERAMRWFGTIADWETRFSGIYCPRERSEHQAALEEARQALGEEAFAAYWKAGQAMTLEQALAEAKADVK